MLRPGKIFIGTELRIEVEFRADDNSLIDPDTVVFKTSAPNGIEATLTYGTDAALDKEATGKYFADVTPDQPGRYHYRWVTTGTGKVSADEGSFIVQDTPFYGSYRSDYN